MGIGSNLWSWQRAQLTVVARTTRLTASICSSTLSMMNRTLNRWLTSFTPIARNPVAIRCSSRSLGELGGKQVAGNLLLDERVVRLVAR